MLTGTAGETTFTIAESGVYMFEFDAIYPADGDRSPPFIEIQQDSDDAVIGRSTTTYLRNSGSPEDGLIIVLDGIVSVPSDGLVVKAVLGNSYNQNSMDADGGKLNLVRIGTGLRGAAGTAGAVGPAGPAGADGVGTGDITAVNTPNNSGLSGGSATGDVDLALDINNLPAVTSVTTGDHFLIADFTDANANKKITADHFGTHLAGPGLESTATGQLELALEEPGLVTALEDTDIVVLADASDSFATKRTTVATLGTHFGPSNALETAAFPTPDATNVYGVVDNFGAAIREPAGGDRSERHLDGIGRR